MKAKRNIVDLEVELMRESMERAMENARKCLASGDVPIGALILRNGEVVGEGYNTIERDGNPLAHAEINAINDAVKNTGHKHLLDCEMYVTLEPCSMCAGAIVLARIPKLIIAADDPKTGACGSVTNIVQEERLNHRCEVKRGVLEKESSEMLKKFFADLRKKKGK
jgi:tRNA(adenine34) deaminase